MNVYALLSLFGYGVSTLFYLLYLLLNNKWFPRLAKGTVLISFLFQSLFLLTLNIQRGQFGVFGQSESMLVFSWFMILGFFIIEHRIKTKFLGVLITPIAFLLCIIAYPLLEKGSYVLQGAQETFKSAWFPLHLLGSFFGEVLLILMAILGVFYLLQERQLKSRRPGFLLHRLPSLESTDRIMEKLLNWGFVFLTLGILSGGIWAHRVLASQWTLDPKQFWALVTWIVYASMIFLRTRFHLKGKRGALLAILGSLVVIFTFLGTNLIYDESHNFWKMTG